MEKSCTDEMKETMEAEIAKVEKKNKPTATIQTQQHRQTNVTCRHIQQDSNFWSRSKLSEICGEQISLRFWCKRYSGEMDGKVIRHVGDNRFALAKNLGAQEQQWFAKTLKRSLQIWNERVPEETSAMWYSEKVWNPCVQIARIFFEKQNSWLQWNSHISQTNYHPGHRWKGNIHKGLVSIVRVFNMNLLFAHCYFTETQNQVDKNFNLFQHFMIERGFWLSKHAAIDLLGNQTLAHALGPNQPKNCSAWNWYCYQQEYYGFEDARSQSGLEV